MHNQDSTSLLLKAVVFFARPAALPTRSLYSFILPFSLSLCGFSSSAASVRRLRFQFLSVLAGSASRHSASQCGRVRCFPLWRVDSSATAALLVFCVCRLYISVCKRFFLLRPGLVDLPLEQARTVFCQKKRWSQRLCDKCLANIDIYIYMYMG